MGEVVDLSDELGREYAINLLRRMVQEPAQFAEDQIRSYVDSIEAIYREAEENGFNVEAIKLLLQDRQDERSRLLEAYKGALVKLGHNVGGNDGKSTNQV